MLSWHGNGRAILRRMFSLRMPWARSAQYLRVVYRDDYDANIAAIETSALFRAYAKPALTALVLHVGAKLRTFVQNVDASHLAEAERSAVGQGIVTLRNRVAVAAEPDRLAFIRALITAVKLAMALFQRWNPRG